MRHQGRRRWLDEHFSDSYVRRAREDGYRSRAAYKLLEIQRKHHILRPGMTVCDLGAAPGGWSQVATRHVDGNGRVIALDVLPIAPLEGVEIVQGDFREQEVLDRLIKLVDGAKVDLVISDMAPNISGMSVIDQPRAVYLSELALELAHQVLAEDGDILIKMFQGTGADPFVRQLRQSFHKVVICKPKASRPRSREFYLLARDYH